MRRVRWWSIIAVCAVLAAPTAVRPNAILSSTSYLLGELLIVVALWAGMRQRHDAARVGWGLFAAAATCWLVGDALQRSAEAWGDGADLAGPPDVFWLASYPLVVAAVAAMFHGRRLDVSIRREVRLDVLVVAVAGAVGAWKLMIDPQLGGGSLTSADLLSVLYPLGDVAVLAAALVLVITPGRRSVAGTLVVVCLTLTLLVDALFSALPVIAPSFDGGQLDAFLLCVNSLLPAAALHRSAGDVAMPRDRQAGSAQMHRWRVVLLGGALVGVSAAAALPATRPGALDRWVLLAATILTSTGIVARFYGVVRRREDAERLLAHRAQHDELTGLAKRSLLLERLNGALDTRGAVTADEVIVLFLDLDGFKAVNDRCGHGAGDIVLTAVGERLRDVTRHGDTVARVGGDEFVVVCRGVAPASVDTLTEKVLAEVTRPIRLPDGTDVRVGVSIGVARTGPHHGTALAQSGEAEQLLGAADSAMYHAKQRGGGVCAAKVRAVSSASAPDASIGRSALDESTEGADLSVA